MTNTSAATSDLRKDLGLFDVYAIATGTTLSAGFFLLPGLAAEKVGPAVVLCYMLAVIPIIPAMLCVVELSTAMPKAGGAYYSLDRSFGPLMGTVGGIGTWLALTLKSAFALVGMGAYIELFFPQLPMIAIGVALAILFGVINFMGTKESGRAQIIMVAILLLLLLAYIVFGVTKVNTGHFNGFLASGSGAIISIAGAVSISYGGITKVTSIAEEVENPERNLPLGVFLALGTAILIYGLGTFVMVGVAPPADLAGDQTLVATTATLIAGKFGTLGKILATVAAMLAFVSVANAGVLSSSRYPMAMSRDHLLPPILKRLSKRGTPAYSIIFSVAAIILFLVVLDPFKIAKLASAFQLLVFAILCASVIVMRESKIASYDPGYRTPFYPYLHIFGMIAPLWLITRMGWLATAFSAVIVTLSVIWYLTYASKRVTRHGAIYHVFERLGHQRFDQLDAELRGILKEKGLRADDPFDEVVAGAEVIDLTHFATFEEVVAHAARLLAPHLDKSADEIANGFLEGTKIGATPVAGGVALPHMRISGIQLPMMVIVRAVQGIPIDAGDAFGKATPAQDVYAVFFLVSPEEDPAQHLRLLAQLAGRVDQEGFADRWLAARDGHALKELLLRRERSISLHLRNDSPTQELINRSLGECNLPESCLVVLLSRGVESIVPRGSTVLQKGDRVTIIGSKEGIAELYRRFGGDSSSEKSTEN